MGEFAIRGLDVEQLGTAAELFTREYQRCRELLPSLPERYERPDGILELLQESMVYASGYGCFSGDKLCGYMLAIGLPDFRGLRSIFIPEWGHASRKEGREEIYYLLYKELAGSWVKEGFNNHLISFFQHQQKLYDDFHWLGFGLLAVDAMRGLEDDISTGKGGKLQVRKAGEDDVDIVLSFKEKLDKYMAESPTLFYYTKEEDEDKDYFKELLTSPGSTAFLAYEGERAVGCLAIGKANDDAAYVINDPQTASIKYAFLEEAYRGSGAGLDLLLPALSWAREHGYSRCSVDFEPENIAARSFWLKHYTPFCYTLRRYIDRKEGGR
ncbi:MAG: GNAT family N-acetyltransferase [Halanaerobium sp.]|nr:GNAT family N-acetyltransferase [Halanaerobium sp.]